MILAGAFALAFIFTDEVYGMSASLPWGVTYRPRKVDEIVGNDDTVNTILDNMEDGTLSSRLLITGHSGTGKTTLSYLLAEWFTGVPYDPDSDSMCVSEINCASDRGIDKMRDTIEKVQLQPLYGKRHVVLLDEVQALTPSAAKALYKPLEAEGDAVWILGTNEPERLTDVLRSRLNRIVMKYPDVDSLVELGRDIHKEERCKFTYPKDAITQLARKVQNVRLFLNTMQDLYQHNEFTNDAVEAAILRSIDKSEITSLDNLVCLLNTSKPSSMVNIMSVYTFWSELIVYAMCTAHNISGAPSEPNYIRQLFTKKLKGGDHDLHMTLHRLNVARNMVTTAGCDGVAAFADVFGSDFGREW